MKRRSPKRTKHLQFEKSVLTTPRDFEFLHSLGPNLTLEPIGLLLPKIPIAAIHLRTAESGTRRVSAGR